MKYKAIKKRKEILGDLFEVAKALKLVPQDIVFLANHQSEEIDGWKVIRLK